MIKLTRIHGEEIYVNEDNIQWIEALPDTTITLLNGVRFIVKEKIEDVLNIIEFGTACPKKEMENAVEFQ